MPNTIKPFKTKVYIAFILSFLHLGNHKSLAYTSYDSTFFAEIELKIEENNKNNDFFASFILLQPLVDESNEDLFAKAKAKIYLSNIFKGMLDYEKAIDELLSGQKLIKGLPNSAKINCQINAELALAYFDCAKFKEADSLFHVVLPQASQFLDKETEGLILLGIGSRELVKKNYTSADNIFEAAEKILLESNPCQAPLILAKKIRLEGLRNNIAKAENYLKSLIKIADSCAIMKYKILGYEEMKGAYFNANDIKSYFRTEEAIDSLLIELEKTTRIQDFKKFQRQIKKKNKGYSTEKLIKQLEKFKTLFYTLLLICLALITWLIILKLKK